MKENKIQIYEIKKGNSFRVKDIFECGQCFRWNEIEKNKYIGIFKNNVVEVSETEKTIKFEGIFDGDIEEKINRYFDLNRNYDEIKEELSEIDEFMKESIKYGKGIRLLNQDLWETIISFIISANNNIPRIKGIIERISEKYGNEIEYKNKKYYTFPTPEELRNVSVEDFRKLGLGFRDIRLYETTRMILNNEVDLKSLEKLKDTEEIRNELLKLPGVGPKVADCILLFSELKRLDVFPIDVWVRRVMNELYIKNDDESKVSKKQIEKLAKEKFGNLEGIAQQYLFYWRREL